MLGNQPNNDGDAKLEAVTAIYEDRFEHVVRYIALRIGNVHDAEDLAGEVFVRALRALDSYQDTGAPMDAWIFRIAHNLLVDYLRKKTRQPANMALEENIAYHHDDLSSAIEREQELEELHQAMDCLTERQWEIIALRFGGNLSAEEIANIVDSSPGAVREMQSAAIKKLRNRLT